MANSPIPRCKKYWSKQLVCLPPELLGEQMILFGFVQFLDCMYIMKWKHVGRVVPFE
jgi:hypothetical protein